MKKLISWVILTAFLLTSCGQQVTGDDVIKSFKAAGLEAETPTAMTKDDYGLAPYVCQGTHFFTPSIDPEAGGRAFICENSEDLQLLSDYYTDLGKTSALFFSWVFVKGNVLVQINGDLPEEKARQYEAAIP
jgi:hypothetical protein